MFVTFIFLISNMFIPTPTNNNPPIAEISLINIGEKKLTLNFKLELLILDRQTQVMLQEQLPHQELLQ